MHDVVFADRQDAGRRLAEPLVRADLARPVVLALPRGGLPVAHEVAQALDAPLDVVVVRKLGVPHRRELAMGAIGERGVVVVDQRTVRECGVSDDAVTAAVARERPLLEEQVRAYRALREAVPVAGRTAVVVDDGLATGATARAACQVVRALGPVQLVLAVPVAPPDSVKELAQVCDRVICVRAPRQFVAVGHWYRDFSQVTDEAVAHALDRSD